MASVDHNLSVYQELADLHDRRKLPQLRDRFLVLAADTAQRGGLTQEAERLRLVLLQLNPQHLLKSFASFDEALRSPDVQSYLSDLRQSYPPDAAEHLLDSVRAEANAAAPGADELPATLAAVNPAGPGAAAKVNEPLKVYRLQNEPKPPPAAPARAEPVRVKAPPVAAPVKGPAGGGRGPVPTAYPLKPEPRAQPGSKEAGDAEGPTGAWLSSLLFLLVLAAGLALAAYTLAGPFLK